MTARTSQPDIPPLACSASPVKSILLALIGILFVVFSGFMTTWSAPAQQIVGWLGIAFFTPCLFAVALESARSGPVVVIDDEGITDRRLRVGTIPWKEIEDISIGSVNRQRFLSVHVRDPNVFLARMPFYARWLGRANTLMGFAPITLGFAGLTPGIDEVVRAIEARLLSDDQRTLP